MNVTDLLVLNFEEVRRRSVKVWTSIPDNILSWRPDPKAMTCSEMIGHVLEGEYLYHHVLIGGGSAGLSNLTNPFEGKRFTTVNDELTFSKPHRENFLNYIKTVSTNDLINIHIDRADVGYVRTLGDMLLRIAYHESVHTGQLLDYLRTAGVKRPNIWD